MNNACAITLFAAAWFVDSANGSLSVFKRHNLDNLEEFRSRSLAGRGVLFGRDAVEEKQAWVSNDAY